MSKVVALAVQTNRKRAPRCRRASGLDAYLVVQLADHLRQALARSRCVARPGSSSRESEGSTIVRQECRTELHEAAPPRAPRGNAVPNSQALSEVSVERFADANVCPVDRSASTVECNGFANLAFALELTDFSEHVGDLKLGKLGRGHASAVEHA